MSTPLSFEEAFTFIQALLKAGATPERIRTCAEYPAMFADSIVLALDRSIPKDHNLGDPIDKLGLSVRVMNRLESHLQRFTIGDLLGCTVDELRDIPNFGDVALEELLDALDKFGYKLKGDPRSA